MKEIFKDIPGYKSRYQISNYGRVKSLGRMGRGRNNIHYKKGRILKLAPDKKGYFITAIMNSKQDLKTVYIHRLVWDNFGDKKRNGSILQIDHIDNNKTNNKISNLQLMTTRQNCTKGWLLKKTASKYTGVGWHNHNKMWRARIWINGGCVLLGYFSDEKEASEAYQKALRGLIE